MGVGWPTAVHTRWREVAQRSPKCRERQHGSIAIVERFILSLKTECVSRILVSFRRDETRTELNLYLDWYNDARPHMSLASKTPNEIYFELRAANQRPQLKPRPRWPRGSPCAEPQVLVAHKCGQNFELVVQFQHNRQHLLLVTLKNVA
jgi:hypothetical protein